VLQLGKLATKYRLGKMPEGESLINNYQFILEKEGFIHLPITMKQALRAGSLQIEHRDPFDRMLMAQAELENLTIITYDSKFHLKHLTIIPSHPSF
jgi:PIN domain nuclease of toxin-antitoxin system